MAQSLRTIPVRTEQIDFTDDYEGCNVTVWMNPPQYLIDDLNDPARKWEALGTLIQDSNMADADGSPIDFKSEQVWGRVLPFELAIIILNRYIEAFNARARLPKANAQPSANSS